jgi:hypothetical protein
MVVCDECVRRAVVDKERNRRVREAIRRLDKTLAEMKVVEKNIFEVLGG